MNIAFFDDSLKSPVESVQFQTNDNRSLSFQIKRDDLIDFSISGNKWRKLKFNFKEFESGKYKAIASFGGAFSNHIAALAFAGQRAEIKTVGFIRTHQIDLNNPTLKMAEQCGMTLVPVSRDQYRLRHRPEFLSALSQQYPDCYFVPEGGSNALAEMGVAELAQEIQTVSNISHIALPFGSGGTTRGLARALPNHQIFATAVVNDEELIEQVKSEFDNVTINQKHLCGGYGRVTPELSQFCIEFFHQTGIPIEPIYSGKLLHSVCYGNEYDTQHLDKTLVIHTGGLQGLKGLLYRNIIEYSDWQPVLQHLGFTEA